MYKMNKMLGGPHSWSGCFGYETLQFPQQKTNVSLLIHPTAQSIMWLSYPSSLSCMLPNAQHNLLVNQVTTQLVMKLHTFINMKVCIHKSLWLVSTLSHISPVTTPYIRSMLILSSCLCPRLLTGLFHSDSFTDLRVLKNYIPLHFGWIVHTIIQIVHTIMQIGVSSNAQTHTQQHFWHVCWLLFTPMVPEFSVWWTIQMTGI